MVNSSFRARRQRGFTLVELLVVIAIIGVLVALLLPAVQAAREAARRAQCGNNLKQLGLAFHNYESTYSTFPFSYTLAVQAGVPGNLMAHGWGVMVLPFVEQSALANNYDYKLSLTAPQNQAVISTHLKVMQCPSTPGQNRLYRFLIPASAIAAGLPSTNLTLDESAGDYAPTSGIRGALSNAAYATFPGGASGDRHGILRANEASRMATVVDGTSNTILVGELAGRNDLWAKVGGKRTIAVPASQHPTPHIPAPPKNYGGGWGNPYNGENWIAGARFSYVDPVNPADITLDGTCPVNCSNYIGRNLFSFHPGIAQAVLGDGSVRSYSETVNGQVLAFMITREKGEVVPSN